MGTRSEGAGRAHLDEVVAEREEGVEGADAEIRDVELREGGGERCQARRGELSRWFRRGRGTGVVAYPVQRGVEGVAGDVVLQARPDRARSAAGGLHGEGDDPVTGCHRLQPPSSRSRVCGRLDLICRDLVSVGEGDRRR
jgi:hypothetical protein